MAVNVSTARLYRRAARHAPAGLMPQFAVASLRFPAHIVPILTSVVIECQRAKMPGEALHESLKQAVRNLR